MKLDMKGATGGFMVMIVSFLGMVLWATLFKTVMGFFDALAAFPTASAYIVFSTIIDIAPTILFIGGVFGAGLGYRQGYRQATGAAGINGLLLIVFGALEIILFLAMFPTIMTALEAIRTSATIANYIALGIVIEIAPAILLLGGLFAGGSAISGGVKGIRAKNSAAPA
jgi:hypothetical protein